MAEDDSIKFNAVDEPWGEFSNHAPFQIKLKGKKWPTAEHYFQAQKFAGTPMEDRIRLVPNPAKAAQMGRSRRERISRTWEESRETVMLEVIRAKFSQHENLRELLLSTGDRDLIDHSETDPYWGDGGDGSGRNRLGQILMQVRAELRQPAPETK